MSAKIRVCIYVKKHQESRIKNLQVPGGLSGFYRRAAEKMLEELGFRE